MSINQEDSNLGNKEVFAENFNYYLKRSGDRKIDVAHALGVSQSTISDWTKLRTYPRMDKVQMLAEHWNIEMSDLVEKHTFDNKNYAHKEAQKLSVELISDKDALELYALIKKLSPSHKDMVKTLVMSLLKEE
jgi:transcriptional regulator with XRE-family HTH domain